LNYKSPTIKPGHLKCPRNIFASTSFNTQVPPYSIIDPPPKVTIFWVSISLG
jgi:hypothetical protein